MQNPVNGNQAGPNSGVGNRPSRYNAKSYGQGARNPNLGFFYHLYGPKNQEGQGQFPYEEKKSPPSAMRKANSNKSARTISFSEAPEVMGPKEESRDLKWASDYNERLAKVHETPYSPPVRGIPSPLQEPDDGQSDCNACSCGQKLDGVPWWAGGTMNSCSTPRDSNMARKRLAERNRPQRPEKFSPWVGIPRTCCFPLLADQPPPQALPMQMQQMERLEPLPQMPQMSQMPPMSRIKRGPLGVDDMDGGGEPMATQSAYSTPMQQNMQQPEYPQYMPQRYALPNPPSYRSPSRPRQYRLISQQVERSAWPLAVVLILLYALFTIST